MTKTIEQIMADEETSRMEYEAREMFKGFTIAELRKVSDAVFSKDHWKNEWAASVPHQVVGAVRAAVEFFHADTAILHGVEPITGKVLMSGRGYQG